MAQYVITGATSGTGDVVIKRLVAQVGAEQITCLVRATSDTRLLRELGVQLKTGDVTDAASLADSLTPTSIYIDMTNPRYYPQTIPVLQRVGITRVFFITTTGIFSRFHRCADVYQHGEEIIKQSGLVYTILRPSMIYGTLRDKNMHRLIQFAQRSPVVPLFNAGSSLMQPVYVDDLAQGIVAAIGSAGTEYQAYNLAGPTGIRYADIVASILANLQRKVWMVNINTQLAYHLVRACQWIPGFPIHDEQILRLQEDKIFDISAAERDLSYCPRSFEEGISLEIAEMRTAGVI